MGSSTDFNGFYSIEVEEKSILLFTYIGMKETKVEVVETIHNVVGNKHYRAR